MICRSILGVSELQCNENATDRQWYYLLYGTLMTFYHNFVNFFKFCQVLFDLKHSPPRIINLKNYNKIVRKSTSSDTPLRLTFKLDDGIFARLLFVKTSSKVLQFWYWLQFFSNLIICSGFIQFRTFIRCKNITYKCWSFLPMYVCKNVPNKLLKYVNDIIYSMQTLRYKWQCFLHLGNGITSFILLQSTRNWRKRSTPSPKPPVGGWPNIRKFVYLKPCEWKTLLRQTQGRFAVLHRQSPETVFENFAIKECLDSSDWKKLKNPKIQYHERNLKHQK